MTDDEVLMHGDRARTLLTSAIFMDALGGFANLHLETLLATSDDDVEGREKAFRLMRGYEAIASDLKARVLAADEIIREREAALDDDNNQYED